MSLSRFYSYHVPFLVTCHKIEQFLIAGVSQNQTKVVTLANHKGDRQSTEPIKARRAGVIKCRRGKARENKCYSVVKIGFGFTSG